MTMPPQAVDGVARAWQAILQAQHPELGRIEVTVVAREPERLGRPASVPAQREERT